MEQTISKYVAYNTCHTAHVEVNTLAYKQISLKQPSKNQILLIYPLFILDRAPEIK